MCCPRSPPPSPQPYYLFSSHLSPDQVSFEQVQLFISSLFVVHVAALKPWLDQLFKKHLDNIREEPERSFFLARIMSLLIKL